MAAFNQLSPAQVERLSLLSEEMGEVQQVIGKILRHGYASAHPDRPLTTNRTLLEKEMGDVMAALKLMKARKDVDYPQIKRYMREKIKRVGKYLHHNKVDDL